MEDFFIKENSFIAKISALKLNTTRVAIVIGNTIHLHNTSKADFLKDGKWLKHELCHVRQFRQHGTFTFLFKYLWESIKHGYYNNKYEIEAREAEEK